MTNVFIDCTFIASAPSAPDVPVSGDAVWIEAANTPDCRAWHAKPEQPPKELAGVTGVQDEGETFTVAGKRPGIYGQPWSVKVRRDAESEPGLLRGVVE